ncbi:DNA-processing protein DprA, partial [Amycolatopsis sp. NPDC003861]
ATPVALRYCPPQAIELRKPRSTATAARLPPEKRHLTAATLVVEAARRSGARNTACLAAKLGRHVLAVPGPISSAASAGCHQLIQDGTARLVTSIDDVIAAIEERDDPDTEPETTVPADEAGRR